MKYKKTILVLTGILLAAGIAACSRQEKVKDSMEGEDTRQDKEEGTETPPAGQEEADQEEEIQMEGEEIIGTPDDGLETVTHKGVIVSIEGSHLIYQLDEGGDYQTDLSQIPITGPQGEEWKVEDLKKGMSIELDNDGISMMDLPGTIPHPLALRVLEEEGQTGE